MIIKSNENIGIGIASPTHLMHVNGVARSTQEQWATSSAARVNKDIQYLTGSIDLIEQLHAVTYRYITECTQDNKSLLKIRIYRYLS